MRPESSPPADAGSEARESGSARVGKPGLVPLGLRTVLLLLVLVAAASPLLSPIDDPDFFWHLQTGAWIWQHASLPQEFLFSLTAVPPMTIHERFTMTSYWMVQILYHLLHAVGGLTAIALLKCALMGILVGSLWAQRRGRDPLLFASTLLLGVIVLRLYSYERPQVFSFVYFSLLLLVLDRLRSREAPPGRLALLALPLLMMVWANSHGAYGIGVGVIVAYLATEGLKLLSPRLDPLPRERYRLLLAAGGAGILAALLNPNTYRLVYVAALPSWLTAGIIEYQSTVTFYRTNNSPVMPVYWLLLALALAGVVASARRPDITRIALLAATGIASFAQIRYVAFFAVAAVPAIAELFSGDGPGRRLGRALVTATALAAGLFFLPEDLKLLPHYGRADDVNTLAYPADAVDYLRSARPPGNIFNYWPWGGYLLWRLAPTKVFSDGRMCTPEVSRMNIAVESGNKNLEGGRPRWRAIFKEYGIRHAVIPIFDPRGGDVLNLLFSLATAPDWVPVFVGVNSVVFVEKPPGGRGVDHLAPANLQRFFGLLLRRCEELNRRYPAYPFPHIGRGDLLAWLGRGGEARAAYLDALRLAPFNQRAQAGLLALGSGARGALPREGR